MVILTGSFTLVLQARGVSGGAGRLGAALRVRPRPHRVNGALVRLNHGHEGAPSPPGALEASRADPQPSSSLRASARARSRTSRTGLAFSWAMRTTSANSGVAVTTRPCKRETLKEMGP